MAIDNKQLARRLIEEVWNKGKIDLIDELVDPNFEGHDPVIGLEKRDTLRESVKGYRTAFPDLKMDITSIVAEGNYVVTRWTARGTNLGPFMGMGSTGRAATVTGINFGEVRNGKLISDYSEYDALGLMRQLGVESVGMPTPGKQTTTQTGKRT